MDITTLAVILASIKITKSEVVGRIQLLEFENSYNRDINGNRCDSITIGSQCDTLFKINISSSWKSNCVSGQCVYKVKSDKPIEKWSGVINFLRDDTGLPNPIEVKWQKWDGGFQLRLDAVDEDYVTLDEDIDYHDVIIKSNPQANARVAKYIYFESKGHREQYKTTLKLKAMMFCGHFYYGNDCATFCNPNLDPTRYKCSENGTRLCSLGWYGPLCAIKCLPRKQDHYRCDSNGNKLCDQGWSGANCDVIITSTKVKMVSPTMSTRVSSFITQTSFMNVLSKQSTTIRIGTYQSHNPSSSTAASSSAAALASSSSSAASSSAAASASSSSAAASSSSSASASSSKIKEFSSLATRSPSSKEFTARIESTEYRQLEPSSSFHSLSSSKSTVANQKSSSKMESSTENEKEKSSSLAISPALSKQATTRIKFTIFGQGKSISSLPTSHLSTASSFKNLMSSAKENFSTKDGIKFTSTKHYTALQGTKYAITSSIAGLSDRRTSIVGKSLATSRSVALSSLKGFQSTEILSVRIRASLISAKIRTSASSFDIRKQISTELLQSKPESKRTSTISLSNKKSKSQFKPKSSMASTLAITPSSFEGRIMSSSSVIIIQAVRPPTKKTRGFTMESDLMKGSVSGVGLLILLIISTLVYCKCRARSRETEPTHPEKSPGTITFKKLPEEQFQQDTMDGEVIEMLGHGNPLYFRSELVLQNNVGDGQIHLTPERDFDYTTIPAKTSFPTTKDIEIHQGRTHNFNHHVYENPIIEP